ncbi:hypothetical protein JQK87_03720 [Streptomyces sp. G44]|uniref:hypothetical protein n=1 Tax=Streptomyces sp. G44 TaxID=2807632 RepID=UPI00195FC240|nr:hypothetical protein [Streptomyces sp. G44]MBM7167533.1 hypothetical protein [Streptomyces sp. G44]
MAYISRPGISSGAHPITSEEIIKLHGSRDGNEEVLPFPADSGLFVRSLQELVDPVPDEERTERAFADVAALSEEAASRAMEEAKIPPGEVGGIITFHDTGRTGTVPGQAPGSLAGHLIAALGLQPTVAHVSLTAMAGTGAAHALAWANVLVRSDRPCLVVGAEANNSLLADSEVPLWQKLRMADGGAAVLVSESPLGEGPTVRITDDWSHAGGFGDPETRAERFPSPSTEEAAVADAWAKLPLTGEGGWKPDFVLTHPSRIPDGVQDIEGLRPGSDDSGIGTRDIGGGTILVRLRSLFDQPVAPRSGLLLGVGPYQASACRIEG